MSFLIVAYNVASALLWQVLGQTPNLDTLQRVLYEQLVSGGRWDEKAAPDVKTQRMGEAFHGQNVLLVLDDLCEYLGLLFSARSQMQSTADRGDQARNGTELHREADDRAMQRVLEDNILNLLRPKKFLFFLNSEDIKTVFTFCFFFSLISL